MYVGLIYGDNYNPNNDNFRLSLGTPSITSTQFSIGVTTWAGT